MSSTRSRAGKTQPYPIVIIPGAAQTATNFTGTPGWPRRLGAILPAPRLYAVYIARAARTRPLRLPGRCERTRRRSPNLVERAEPFHRAGARQPLAAWRGCTRNGRARALPAIRCSTSSSPRKSHSCRSREVIQALNRDAAVAAARQDRPGDRDDRIRNQAPTAGRSSERGLNLVKALLQVEPSAPPVHDMELIRAPDYFRDGAVTRAPGALGAIPLAIFARRQRAFGAWPSSSRSKADGRTLPNAGCKTRRARQLS